MQLSKKNGSFKELISSYLINFSLASNLAKREIDERYKGSVAGMLWGFLIPIIMVLVYYFVFSVVFEARWGGERETDVNFALHLFSGLLIHTLLAEMLTQGPSLILRNQSYVKKILFPLEILPLVCLLASLSNMSIGLCILLLGLAIDLGGLSWTIVLLPVVLVPFLTLLLALGFFLSALGVFLRDINQLTGVLVTVLLFLSPIFFSPEALPEQYRVFIYLNPISLIVEEARAVVIWGLLPNFWSLAIYMAISAFLLKLAYMFFCWSRRAFADVM